mmetsp:Transcript_23320/g.34261  ORF Transcript_23320/g.34261 Transcript_23320/m.34261 type:complete len:265 (+) Transcript_23320:84-878(+)
MGTAEERPQAKPPWVTPTSTAHPSHPHTLDHTPTIIANQANQPQSRTPTAPTPNLHCSIQPQISKLPQQKSTYAPTSELKQRFKDSLELLYALVLQSGQEKGSALAPNTARSPTEAPPQRPTFPCPTKRTAAARFQRRLLQKRQSPPKAHTQSPPSIPNTSTSPTSRPDTVPRHRLQPTDHPQCWIALHKNASPNPSKRRSKYHLLPSSTQKINTSSDNRHPPSPSPKTPSKPLPEAHHTPTRSTAQSPQAHYSRDQTWTHQPR